MRALIISLAMTMSAAMWPSQATAGELAFPTTEKEIVAALSLKDGEAVVGNVKYVSEGGKVYEVIGGKRFRMRDPGGIVDTGLAPKAGALIRFDFDSATIRPESFELLDAYGKTLSGGLSKAKLQIGGHTDSLGTDEYNLELARKRAEAVRQYLLSHHRIASDHLEIAAYGATKPLETNDTDSGRAKNRRVEFVRYE